MHQYAYFAGIMFPLVSITAIDYKYKVAWWSAPKKTAKVLAIALTVFLLWDIAGIHMGIFFSGKSEYMTNVYLLKDLPFEELFFLYFLNYFVLVATRMVAKNA